MTVPSSVVTVCVSPIVEQEPVLPSPPAEHDWKLDMYLERFAVDLARAATTGSGGERKRAGWPRHSPPSLTCCCWMNRPITWISRPSKPCRSCSRRSVRAHHHSRSRIPGPHRDPHRGAGSRCAALLPGEFRTLPGAQGTGTGLRKHFEQPLRQGAGAGRGVDPQGCRGTAHAQ